MNNPKRTFWGTLPSSPASVEWLLKLSKKPGFTPLVLPREVLQHNHCGLVDTMIPSYS